MTGFAQAITFLYASDPAASRRFYADVLGLSLVVDQGTCAIFAVTSGGWIGICDARGPRRPGDARHEGGVVLSFVADDVEAWHDRLCRAGVPIAQAPTLQAAIGVTSCFFRDPAGYLLEVQRFERPVTPPEA